MLEKLFSSKARIAVLKLFLFNPEDSYYLREISSLANIPIRGVQREVKKLKEIGLLEDSVSGNRVYYRANRKSPIFEDLKRIFFKTEGIVKALKESFEDKKKIDFAFIYGSYAKGEETTSSDIDLMVLGDIQSKKLSKILSGVKENLQREINFVVISMNEFIKRINDDDNFLNSVVKEPRIMILGRVDELKRAIEKR